MQACSALVLSPILVADIRPADEDVYEEEEIVLLLFFFFLNLTYYREVDDD